MKCTICNLPIVLVPFAQERAKKFGEPPEFYTKLFTTHSDCELAKRAKEASELMKEIRNETARRQQDNRPL